MSHVELELQLGVTFVKMLQKNLAKYQNASEMEELGKKSPATAELHAVCTFRYRFTIFLQSFDQSLNSLPNFRFLEKFLAFDKNLNFCQILLIKKAICFWPHFRFISKYIENIECFTKIYLVFTKINFLNIYELIFI